MRTAESFAFATLTTLTAGFVDAIGYTHIGKLYLSFMSGNTTRLGLAIAEGDRTTLILAAAVIFSFVAGSGLGTLLTDMSPRRGLAAVLVTEVLLFVLALVLVVWGSPPFDLLPIAVAMGMQNSVHQVVLGADIGKSFVTGALFSLGQSLARAARDRKPPEQCLVYATSWLTFISGVVLGGLVLMHTDLVTALIGSTLVLAMIAVIALRQSAWTPA